MKQIICYCCGGLGNRLRPLASCYAYAKKTNRELVIYWNNTIPNGCLAPWDKLFENNIKNISENELSSLKDCINYVDANLADRELSRGIPVLRSLVNQYGALGRDNVALNFDNENIIFYCNNFMRIFSKEENDEFLKQLKPIKIIQDNIDKYEKELGLNKTIIGAHVRGTDFGKPFEFYIEQINSELKNNPNQKIFLCSDDLDWEEKIVQMYPNNIVRRKKNNYIVKNRMDLPWQDCTSFTITIQHAQEAVEDIFLLSKTNIKIYHPESTFAEIARRL